ncbi:MAG: hypothetical protein KAR11_06755 [Phycisphaerae bacterium]|nr:hypothetical protein [Phycisphaerae bacterium]
MSSKRKNSGKNRDGEKCAKSGGGDGKNGDENVANNIAGGSGFSRKNSSAADSENFGGTNDNAGNSSGASAKSGEDDATARYAAPDDSNKTLGAGAGDMNLGDGIPIDDEGPITGTAPGPCQKSTAPPNPKNPRRLRRVDARALANLLCWSIDLIDRQRNLLRTALDIVRDPEK